MLLYPLDPITFDRIAVIEEYESCVWTERFIEAGDFTLVLAEVNPHAALLRGGTVIENGDSEFPMLIEGIERADGSLTITGRTIETFFNEISLSPKDYDGEDPSAVYFYEGSTGDTLIHFVHLLQNDDAALEFPGFFVSTTELDQADDGSTVDGKVIDREYGHDLLLRLAHRYNVDIYIKRVEDLSNEANGPGTYKFAWGSRTSVNRSTTDTLGSVEVRFSPEDDNLIDVQEAYDATADVSAMVVRVPEHFTKEGSIGDGVSTVMYGYRPSVGHNDFLISLASLQKPPLEIRIKEADSEKLTVEYLRDQLWRYYPGDTRDDWSSLTKAEKSDVLLQEMQRLAIGEFNKAQRLRGHVIDGEVVSDTYTYGVHYKLGDKVSVTSGLTPNIPYSVTEKQVNEFIRSVDDTGTRAYPTLAPITTAAQYTSSSHEINYPKSTYVDHTFSINGKLPATLGVLSPHKIKVKKGETKQLVDISQTGPDEGSCSLDFLLNGDYIDISDLPITLADGDLITIDASDHSSDANNVSGHFTLRIKE
jgi:hypothetical protein